MLFTQYSLLDQVYFCTLCLSIVHFKFTNKIHQLFTDYLLRLPYSELLETHLFRSRANRRLVDLRLSPPTSPKSNVSSVRALHFYTGDDEDEISNQHGDVRAVVTEMPDEGDMQSILLDSGADAAVFPSTFCKVRSESIR